MIARYCEATGRDGLPDLHWYFAYNLFRLAGIVQGVKKRLADGNASSAEAAATAARVLPLARSAWAEARKAGATGTSEMAMDVFDPADKYAVFTSSLAGTGTGTARGTAAAAGRAANVA